MTKRFPIMPAHPERICWGCDRYCPADALACGNGSERTPHLAELFGDDWQEWTPPAASAPGAPGADAAPMPAGAVPVPAGAVPVPAGADPTPAGAQAMPAGAGVQRA